MLKISKGKISRPQKVVIYGPEGIGKSSLAAQFPDPVIIDTEGGTSHMDVRRIDKPKTWDELLSIIKEVALTPGVCKTLVIDTADWAEQLIVSYLCAKYKQQSIESFGYGKGYTYMSEEFSRMLSLCDLVIAAGIHTVITAHAKMRKFEQPDEMGAYDRWEMKLSKQTAPLLKEWCDILLFCNYRTFVVTSENDSKKAQGGKRVIYTSHHPAWDAKTRVPLPEILDLDYANIAVAVEGQTKQQASDITDELSDGYTVYDRFRQLTAESGFTEDDVRRVVAMKGHFSEDTPVKDYGDAFITGWIFKYWPQITEIIERTKKEDNE
jgi:hypothetical protein